MEKNTEAKNWRIAWQLKRKRRTYKRRGRLYTVPCRRHTEWTTEAKARGWFANAAAAGYAVRLVEYAAGPLPMALVQQQAGKWLPAAPAAQDDSPRTMKTRPTPMQKLIAKHGGTAAVAKDARIPYRTVQAWAREGHPDGRRPQEWVVPILAAYLASRRQV